jgi:outer membrane protein assembly factor BamA
VRIFPDYNSLADLSNANLITRAEGGVKFLFHRPYVHPHVIYEHAYLTPGNTYSQADYDKTIAKLTELGIFQYIRIVPNENHQIRGGLDYDVYLKKSKKHDFLTNYELSSGSTYFLGNSLSVNYRDRNLLKGANLLNIGVNGGVELSYNENDGKTLAQHFSMLTKYYGVNASIDFPKFLAPVASSLFNNSNLPHTIIGGGENVIDRLNYFTLLNTSANFSYNWRQNQDITWTLSPAFVNIIKLPQQSPSFDLLLANNEYLRNSYKENFIEGESISFIFDNINRKHGADYSYLKLGLEEAGGLLSFINKVYTSVNDIYKLAFAQYTKVDFDARHYFTYAHSVLAMRFYGGVGIPYGQSGALPYIKQYFAGGPYSLRGWRIRTLGPGSYLDQRSNDNNSQIDRTGDIKLEYNCEYRFPVAPLFAGAVKMNGALFFDAGNIWLANADTSFPGGNFTLATMGQDLAADLGLGARFDIAQFLTLRVDVAMPIKKPYIHSNGGWVFDEIAPYNATWRANNIIFNISIGYPF